MRRFYSGKRVLVTGHTGFKGSWLSQWLISLGADVVGVALEVVEDQSLFDQLGLRAEMDHNVVDIRDLDRLRQLVVESTPDVLFHLAAQPLVRQSYAQPVDTFATNILGTVHVMEVLRNLGISCHAVMVTTDKVYENDELGRPYAEGDRVGGHDPYSASKAAAELAIASYRRSFFAPASFGESHEIALASARAGNVIGGGDWAQDRIIPDAMRALMAGEPIHVRNPRSTRPWQHVLDPLGGYLQLAMRMESARGQDEREMLFGPFNFGPTADSNRSVQDLIEAVLQRWDGSWVDGSRSDDPHEASLLALDIGKARDLLRWAPAWGFEAAVDATVAWYRAVASNEATAKEVSLTQIAAYEEVMASDS